MRRFQLHLAKCRRRRRRRHLLSLGVHVVCFADANRFAVCVHDLVDVVSGVCRRFGVLADINVAILAAVAKIADVFAAYASIAVVAIFAVCAGITGLAIDASLAI